VKDAINNNPSKPIMQSYNHEIAKKRQELKVNYSQKLITTSLPTFQQLSSSAYKVRSEHIPIGPQSREHLILENEWTNTVSEKQFLIINHGSKDKILVFFTKEFFEMLSSAKTVFADGTFKSVPKLFLQLYALHCSYLGQVMPMVCALLPDKKCNTYVRFFRLLQEFGIENQINFSPKHIQIDFEMSVIKAVKIVFPNIKVTGCYFHFSQSHWRKIQELGLKSQYEKDMLFQTQVKRITALPFLPLEDISGAWDKIYEKRIDDGINGLKNKYMQYVYNTWVKENSTFSREIWNQFKNYNKRTTNDLESWHNIFNRSVGKVHANIFEFINSIKSEQ
jgi:hypothetical protein